MDLILEDEFTYRFGPASATEALTLLAKVSMPRCDDRDELEALPIRAPWRHFSLGLTAR